MNAMIAHLVLMLGGLLAWGQAHAQYNLRTVPVNPPAGVPFAAVFDSNECETFLLTEPATPATVAIQGNTVLLEVDRIYAVSCTAPPMSLTLNLPALSTGTYQLELYARTFQGTPGTGVLSQTVSFQVGPATDVGTFSIPANDPFVQVLLACLLMGLGYTVLRKAR
jgi:hypothetical protein